MPNPKASALHTTDLERRAINVNLVLGATRRKIKAAAAVLGFTDANAVFSFVKPGVDAQREEDEWEVGPSRAFPLPIFNQGRLQGEAELLRVADK